MKIQNAPGAYGFLAGAIVLILGLLVNASCAHASKLDGWPHIEVRYEAAVQITATCVKDGKDFAWNGSGVIVGPTRVLTAGHVAETEGATCMFVAETAEGAHWLIRPRVVMSSDEIDLASMDLVSPRERFPAYTFRYGPRPQVGSTVCTATAYPRREHKCGEVQKYKALPGDIRVGIVIEPGNSGSGLFDTSGRLVGIVVHLYACQNGQLCSGAATSLEGRVDELLK